MNEQLNSKIPTNKLREFRVIPRISQSQLALLSGVKQSRISLIENCLVKPTMKEKTRLSEALKLSIDEVFEEKEDYDTTISRS
jgi:DNA-binding XRE family transcriptional regulator